MKRRSLILQMGASAIASLTCGSAHAQSGALRGCRIMPSNAATASRVLLANPAPESAGPIGLPVDLDLRSGVSQAFEQQLGRVLGAMSRYFGVTPGFGFYSEAREANAIAYDHAVARNTNGTVAFGRNLLQSQLQIDQQGVSVVAICAHEFGHIYQFRSGLHGDIERRFADYLVELHADFLAGAYLHAFEQSRPVINLQGVGRAWESMGDSRFTRESTHGTTAMRIDSIEGGYFWARDHPGESLYQLAVAGIDHVSQHSQ